MIQHANRNPYKNVKSVLLTAPVFSRAVSIKRELIHAGFENDVWLFPDQPRTVDCLLGTGLFVEPGPASNAAFLIIDLNGTTSINRPLFNAMQSVYDPTVLGVLAVDPHPNDVEYLKECGVFIASANDAQQFASEIRKLDLKAYLSETASTPQQ